MAVLVLGHVDPPKKASSLAFRTRASTEVSGGVGTYHLVSWVDSSGP